MSQVATQPESESALVLVESYQPLQLFTPGFIDPLLDRIKAEVRSIATDISTDAGRQQIKSLAFKVARSKTFIDNQRLKLVKDEKDRLKAIDREGARIWDELEALQKEVRQPLTDWEDAEKDRVAAHEAAITEIEAAGPYTLQNWQTLSIECMQDRLAEIQNDKRDWQEFTQRAKYAKDEAGKAITSAIEKRTASDAEKAELTRLRREAAAREQKEREERIAREAKEKAEQEAREREGKARLEAALERQRMLRLADQRQLQAIVDERQRVAAIEAAECEAQAKREADKTHKAKVNCEALAGLRAAGFDEETGKTIIAAIAKGKVPHVRIEY